MSQAESPNTDVAENTALNSDDILAYLREHPEFLQQYPQALEHQRLDHECGDATSLVERQVKTLRQRIQDYADKLSELLSSARRNDVQFEKTKRLIVELSACDTLAATAAALNHSFVNEFHAHTVRLILLQEHAEQHDNLLQITDPIAQQPLLSMLDEKAWAFCHQVPGTALADLLDNTEETIQSCAILPVRRQQQTIAVIIVASTSEDHYTQGLDTLFLNHVAAVSSSVIGRIYDD